MNHRLSDAEYELAINTKVDREGFAELAVSRLEARACFCCGAPSGDEPLLPPGWSFTVYGDGIPEATGEIAGFFCDRCSARLGFAENRNYGEDRN